MTHNEASATATMQLLAAVRELVDALDSRLGVGYVQRTADTGITTDGATLPRRRRDDQDLLESIMTDDGSPPPKR